MVVSIVIACALAVVTTIIHAAAMEAAFRRLRIANVDRLARRSGPTKVAVVAAVVVVMFLASVIEAGVWAAAYLVIGAISGVERALYFSIVIYTTLGLGDVAIAERWHLMSSLEAANGIIMFGWTTALIVATVQRVYFPDSVQQRHGA